MSSEAEKKNRIMESKEKWEENVLQKNLQRFGIKESPIEYYTPADLDGHDFLEDVGFPGQYPYTSGRHAFPIHVPVWGRGKSLGLGKSVRHSFGYSGYGTPEDLRDFYIQQGGSRGPNIAFDLPSQIGFDSDHELSEGEVGRVGVAVDTLKDLEIIYEPFTGDSEIDKISSNWTINGNSNIILAMYCALADKRGIPWDKLKGTPQNDILKEFVARGTQFFPIEHHMRLMRDTITFCTEHMPKMNTCSIAGFHIREAGATRVQAVSFTFANAIAYFNEAIKAGLDVDTFAGRFTFLNFGGGMEVIKEAAVRRAARRVWAKIMRERFGSKNSKNWIYKELGASLAGYWPMTRVRPLNNVVRVAIGAAFAAMIGEPPVCEPPYDEPLGLGHSIEARQLAADAARVVAEECKLMDVQDVFAGSYYVESLTNRYEKEISDLIVKIDDRGGAVKAIQSGWMKDQIVQSSIDFHRRMTSGDMIQVGVNKYTEEDEIEISIPRTSPYSAEKRENAEERKIESLRKLKAARDKKAVHMHLEKIENATKDKGANLLPLFIDAVKEYVSLGEICQAMKNVVGEFND